MIKLNWILSFAVWLCLSSCATLKPVEYRKAENFSITSNNNVPVLNFSLVFYNPNNFGCTVTKVESEGKFKDQVIFNAATGSSIRAGSRSDIHFPVTARISQLDFSQLIGTGLNLLLNDEAFPVKVSGTVRIRKFIFARTYRFDFTQAIDKALIRQLF